MSRDEFPAKVKDELAKRVAYLCSNPRCRQSTSGPRAAASGTVNIGVAAHITAASPGGPRYDPSLSEAERSSVGNGIWLCQTCAKLIDSDIERYPVDKLLEWKSDAEAAAAKALEVRLAPVSASEGVFLEAARLMPELIAEMREDVQNDDTELIREFVVLRTRSVRFAWRKDHFVYYIEEHPHLIVQLDWLEEMGALIDVARRDTPMYRMTPEFFRWLREAHQAIA